jgi:hypothetical protein
LQQKTFQKNTSPGRDNITNEVWIEIFKVSTGEDNREKELNKNIIRTQICAIFNQILVQTTQLPNSHKKTLQVCRIKLAHKLVTNR